MDSFDNPEEYVGGFTYQRLRDVGISRMSALNLVRHIKAVSYEPRQIVWHKGSEITSWNFIVTGLIAASILTNNSKTTPVSIYGERTWFGESSIVNKMPSYADYICLTSVDVFCLPAPLVLLLLEKELNFSSTVMKMISWRAQCTSETLMLMKLGNPCLRVVMGLCQFAESLQYNADRPPTIGLGEGVSIPVKQDIIASLCGVSRTLFSEYVLNLAQNGWVRVTYSNIEFLNMSAWLRFAQVQRRRSFSNLNPTMEALLSELKECDPHAMLP